MAGGERQGTVKQRQRDVMRESESEKEKYSKWTGCRLVERMRGENIPSRDSYHHDNPLLSPLLSSCMMNSCYFRGPQHGQNIQSFTATQSTCGEIIFSNRFQYTFNLKLDAFETNINSWTIMAELTLFTLPHVRARGEGA